jgi:hypothetical protein|tara:strand:- start:50 stop:388 length:339 start_codon:yes stop_codon:yes gene_type:complete
MFTFNKNYKVAYGNKRFEQDPLYPADLPEGHEHYNIPLYTLWGMTLEEATEISSTEKWKQIRAYRDNLLSETDWWAVQDRTISTDQQNYRQSLRDITNESNPNDIVWPTKPD